jgi:hypothetical protein
MSLKVVIGTYEEALPLVVYEQSRRTKALRLALGFAPWVDSGPRGLEE